MQELVIANRLDHARRRFVSYRHDPTNSYSLSSNAIFCMSVDPAERLAYSTIFEALADCASRTGGTAARQEPN